MREELQDAELIYIATTPSRVTGFDVGAIPQAQYPFGEPIVNHRDLPAGEINTIIARPSNMASFFQTMFFVDALAERGKPVPHLSLPFVPGSRQDRLNDTGDYLFTAKSIAREINMRNFPTVTVYDPHSEVTPALIDRCRVVTPAKIMRLGRYTSGHGWDTDRYSAVIAPDAGAVKRATQVADMIGVPMLQAFKKRDVGTGKLSGFGIEKIDKSILEQQKNLLIVDDICDGGGTFIGLADAIKRDYPDVWLDLYVTHGIFSKGMNDLWDRFKNIITTNSIVRHENLATTVIDLLI